MGAFVSQESRKISFDNNFALPPVVPLNKYKNNSNKSAHLNISSKEIFREQSDEIGNEDDSEYWKKRMVSLENEHQMINKIMQDEYETTLKNTSKLFQVPRPTQDQLSKLRPCIEWESKVLKCYEENPRQPLKCSKIVQAFNNCVTTYQAGV